MSAPVFPSSSGSDEALRPFVSKLDWPLQNLADTDVIQCRVVTPDYETGGIDRAFFGLTVGDFRRLAAASSGVAQAAPEPVAYRWQYGADRRWEYSETQRKNTYHQMEPLYTSPPEALPAGENTKIRAVLRDWQNQLAEFEAMKARGDLTKDWGECSLISARRIVGDLTQALPSTDRQPGPLVPWELKCQREVCAAPECDCPAVTSTEGK